MKIQEKNKGFWGIHTSLRNPLNFVMVCRTVHHTHLDSVLEERTLSLHQILNKRAQRCVFLIDKHFSKLHSKYRCAHLQMMCVSYGILTTWTYTKQSLKVRKQGSPVYPSHIPKDHIQLPCTSPLEQIKSCSHQSP